VGAAATILLAAIEASASAAEIALWVCADVLIPISTVDFPTIVKTLIARIAGSRGVDAGRNAATVLLNSIKTWGLAETRRGWFRGVREGLCAVGFDESEVGFTKEEVSEHLDEYSGRLLSLTDGRQLSEGEVVEALKSPEDLLSLMALEASSSHFDWTPRIRTLAGELSADDAYALASRIHLRRKESVGLAALSDRLRDLGDRRRAWEVAMMAVERAAPNGWDRYYDGGTMICAFEALVKIDPERARPMAFDSLVSYLHESWYPLSTTQNLNRISRLLCQDVPVLDLWMMIESYLKVLFADVESVGTPPSDCDDDTPAGAVTDMLCRLFGHPTQALSHGVMRTACDLLLAGNTEIVPAMQKIVQNPGVSASDVMIVMEAVSERDTSRIELFREEIEQLRHSADQALRWSGERLANRLGLPEVGARAVLDVLSKYQRRAIHVATARVHGKAEDSSFGVLPDTVDPREMIGPWMEEVKILARAAGLPVDRLLPRIVEFMRKLAEESTWIAAGEQALRTGLDRSELEFTFRRPRALVARSAILHVLAELADGRLISDENLLVLHSILRYSDPDLVLKRPIPRPLVIGPAVRPEHNEYKRDWLLSIPLPVVRHWGPGYDTPGDGWIAFDPSVAREIGWVPSEQGFLAWERDGQLMVETVWWNDGLIDQQMPFYRKSEVGEGWLVVGSGQAFSDVQAHFGPLKRVGVVSREIFTNRTERHCESKVFEIEMG
jgi:hypothetical protein